VRADGDGVGLAGADGFHHYEGVAVGGARAGEMGWSLRLGLGFATGDRAGQGGTGDSRGVEAARDVGLVDHGEEFEVGPASPVAVGLAEVDVQEGFVLDGAHGAVPA